MSLERLQKIMDEQMKDPKVRAKVEEIQDRFRHMIYVSPKIYRLLVSLNIAIPGKELKNFKDIYYVFTKPYHHPTREPLCFYTTKKKAMAINELLENKPQFMFPGRDGIRYRDGKLTIDRILIDISCNEDRMILCNLLFGYGRAKKKFWELTELDTKYTQHFDNNSDRYQYYRNRVRSLNSVVFEASGYEEIVCIDKNKVFRNPAYKGK